MAEVSRNKRKYERPSLQRLGSVSSLTAGGTGMTPESAGQPQGMS